MPEEKQLRFQKEFQLPVYDAEILTRDKETSDFFEECVRVGKTHGINPKQIANNIINKKIDIKNILPAQLITNLISSTKTVAVDENKLKDKQKF